MWVSYQRSPMEGLLETDWRAHFTFERESGSKVVFQAPKNKTTSKQPGINVLEEKEMLKDYVDDEVRLDSS